MIEKVIFLRFLMRYFILETFKVECTLGYP